MEDFNGVLTETFLSFLSFVGALIEWLKIRINRGAATQYKGYF